MKFLLRWAVRLGAVVLFIALVSSSQLAGTVVAFIWTGYLFWAARDTLIRHIRAFWALTSFRSYSPVSRLGRLKGDTL